MRGCFYRVVTLLTSCRCFPNFVTARTKISRIKTKHFKGNKYCNTLEKTKQINATCYIIVNIFSCNNRYLLDSATISWTSIKTPFVFCLLRARVVTPTVGVIKQKFVFICFMLKSAGNSDTTQHSLPSILSATLPQGLPIIYLTLRIMIALNNLCRTSDVAEAALNLAC